MSSGMSSGMSPSMPSECSHQTGVALQIAWARRAAPVAFAPPAVAPVAVPRAEPLHVPLDDDHLWKPR